MLAASGAGRAQVSGGGAGRGAPRVTGRLRRRCLRPLSAHFSFISNPAALINQYNAVDLRTGVKCWQLAESVRSLRRFRVCTQPGGLWSRKITESRN